MSERDKQNSAWAWFHKGIVARKHGALCAPPASCPENKATHWLNGWETENRFREGRV